MFVFVTEVSEVVPLHFSNKIAIHHTSFKHSTILLTVTGSQFLLVDVEKFEQFFVLALYLYNVVQCHDHVAIWKFLCYSCIQTCTITI